MSKTCARNRLPFPAVTTSPKTKPNPRERTERDWGRTRRGGGGIHPSIEEKEEELGKDAGRDGADQLARPAAGAQPRLPPRLPPPRHRRRRPRRQGPFSPPLSSSATAYFAPHPFRPRISVSSPAPPHFGFCRSGSYRPTVRRAASPPPPSRAASSPTEPPTAPRSTSSAFPLPVLQLLPLSAYPIYPLPSFFFAVSLFSMQN